MNDFFTLIFEHAVNSGALNVDCNRDYRAALYKLTELIRPLNLDSATYDSLMDAVYGLCFCAEIACLAYGFRLAAQVTAPVLPGAPANG